MEVRKNSFNTKMVKYEDHVYWIRAKLESEDSNIYILENEDIPIGVIRLDNLHNNYKLINFSIDRNHRGQGYASLLLELIKIKFEEYILVGEIKKDNIGSIKAFQRAGYFMKEKLDHLTFYSKNK